MSKVFVWYSMIWLLSVKRKNLYDIKRRVEWENIHLFQISNFRKYMDVPSPFKCGLRVGDKPEVKSTEGLSRLPHSTIPEPLYYFSPIFYLLFLKKPFFFFFFFFFFFSYSSSFFFLFCVCWNLRWWLLSRWKQRIYPVLEKISSDLIPYLHYT